MLRRSSYVFLEVVVALAFGLALLAGVAVWRFTQGPVSLTFLKAEIESALSQVAAPLEIRLDSTSLTWVAERGALEIRAGGLHAFDATGEVVARAPEATVRLSLSAMLRGLVAPTAIELIGPKVRLVRGADGTIAFGVDMGDDGAVTRRPHAIGNLAGAARNLGHLTRLRITSADLTVDDARTGRRWTAAAADIEFRRDGTDLAAELRARVEIGLSEATIIVRARHQLESEWVQLDADLAGIDVEALARYDAALAPLAALKTRIGGRIASQLGLDGWFGETSFELSGDAGRLELKEHWPNGLPFKSLIAQGRIQGGPLRVALDWVEADLGGPRLAVRGNATEVTGTLAIDGEATLREVPVPMLRAYWPPYAAKNARRWLVENLTAGTIHETRFNFSLRADPEGKRDLVFDAMTGTMRLGGVTVHYLKPLPPVVNAQATAAFTIDGFDITVNGGETRGLRVSEGTVRLSGFNDPDQLLALELVIAGPFRDALTILGHPRFDFLSRIGIDPAGADGIAATRLAMRFMLIDRLTFDGIEIRAASNLRRVAVKGMAYGHDLTEGSLLLRLDKNGMDVSGEAQIAGVPAMLTWYEAFDDKAAARRRYDVSATLAPEAQRRLGIEFAPYGRGPIALQASYIERKRGEGEIVAKLDLAEAALAIPLLGWSKPAGAPADAKITALIRNGRLAALDGLELAAGRLKAAGAVAFGDDGKSIERARVSAFSLDASDLAATLARAPNGGYRIAVKGASLDAAPFLRSEAGPLGKTNGGDGDRLPPINVSFDLERLWVGNGPPIEDMKGSIDYDGREWGEIALNGKLAEKHDLRLRFGREGTGQGLLVQAMDAGETLRVFGITERVNGGRLELSAVRADPGAAAPWKGVLAVSDFSVTDAPALARLLSLASFTGISDVVSGGNFRFSRLDAPFTFKDDVVTVVDGRAVGSELGITANGAIDVAAETLRLDGTIAPAYTLNSVLGNIPLIGQLLTGEKGSGVFAATYRAEGGFEAPKFSVNPFAALTPGILRNLFFGPHKDVAPGFQQEAPKH